MTVNHRMAVMLPLAIDILGYTVVVFCAASAT